MPPRARTAREAWVGAGLAALAEGGPDAVRVEALAARLGVTKGGFYWHFENRRALLDAILDAWERVSVDAVIERVDAGAGHARDRLRALFALAASRPDLLAADLAVRDWSRHDAAVARRLRRVDDRRMDYMRARFAAFCEDEEEVEVRCTLVFSLFVGHHFMAARHPGRTRAEVLDLALRRLLA